MEQLGGGWTQEDTGGRRSHSKTSSTRTILTRVTSLNSRFKGVSKKLVTFHNRKMDIYVLLHQFGFTAKTKIKTIGLF